MAGRDLRPEDPGVLSSVQLLRESCCPTCGCDAYDDDLRPFGEDTPLRRFMRRLAWAGEALGVELSLRVEARAKAVPGGMGLDMDVFVDTLVITAKKAEEGK